MREIAVERGLSILELSRSAERNVSIDHEIDARTRRLGAEADHFVIDARLAWHFLPKSVKVFLEVRPETAASRIYGAGRAGEHENIDLAGTKEAIARRTASEVERYERYYGVDYLAPSNFDVIIDTSDLDIPGVISAICAYLAEMAGNDDPTGQPGSQHLPL